MSTPFLLPVLSEAGESELAYEVLLQEDNPSWIYAINKGATTVWEDWEGISEVGVATASQNHYSKGAVANWFFEYICGIQMDQKSPAYKHFYLKPQPGGDLTFAQAIYQSINGEIKSRWEQHNSMTHYFFTVPTNTSATVKLENVGTFLEEDEVLNFKKQDSVVQFDLNGGTYKFHVKDA